MAVSDFALISLEDAKGFLGLTDANSDRDTFLEGEIQRQSSRVESYLDRNVKARFYREDLYPNYNDCYTLYPKQTPILEVVNLYSDAERNFSADSRIEADAYSVNRNSIEFADTYAPNGDFVYPNRRRKRSIRLEYAAGWGLIEIPFSRQRIDLMELSNGERLTFYLDAGIHSPKAIVEQLNTELNTAGEHRREVSFDWRLRQFRITQAEGELTLLTRETGVFTEPQSALPLLGFKGSGLTGSTLTGASVMLDIPADLKGAVLNLLALDYEKSSFGKHKSRGLSAIQISTYRATFANPGDGSMTDMGFPKEIEAVLDQYKHWNIVGTPGGENAV